MEIWNNEDNQERPNKALEPTAPLLSHGLLLFAVYNLGARQAVRQTRGYHPAQRLAAQRNVRAT